MIIAMDLETDISIVWNPVRFGTTGEKKSLYLVLANEGMPMARGVHVFVSVLDQANRSSKLPGWNASSSCDWQGPGLLPPETPSQALGLSHNLMRWDAQSLCHNHLVVHGSLGKQS